MALHDAFGSLSGSPRSVRLDLLLKERYSKLTLRFVDNDGRQVSMASVDLSSGGTPTPIVGPRVFENGHRFTVEIDVPNRSGLRLEVVAPRPGQSPHVVGTVSLDGNSLDGKNTVRVVDNAVISTGQFLAVGEDLTEYHGSLGTTFEVLSDLKLTDFLSTRKNKAKFRKLIRNLHRAKERNGLFMSEPDLLVALGNGPGSWREKLSSKGLIPANTNPATYYLELLAMQVVILRAAAQARANGNVSPRMHKLSLFSDPIPQQKLQEKAQRALDHYGFQLTRYKNRIADRAAPQERSSSIGLPQSPQNFAHTVEVFSDKAFDEPIRAVFLDVQGEEVGGAGNPQTLSFVRQPQPFFYLGEDGIKGASRATFGLQPPPSATQVILLHSGWGNALSGSLQLPKSKKELPPVVDASLARKMANVRNKDEATVIDPLEHVIQLLALKIQRSEGKGRNNDVRKKLDRVAKQGFAQQDKAKTHVVVSNNLIKWCLGKIGTELISRHLVQDPDVVGKRNVDGELVARVAQAVLFRAVLRPEPDGSLKGFGSLLGHHGDSPGGKDHRATEALIGYASQRLRVDAQTVGAENIPRPEIFAEL